MSSSVNVYFFIAPLIVFGPLFLWLLYSFGLREIAKIPGEIRRQNKLNSEKEDRFERERARKRGRGPVGVVRGANTSVLGLFAQAITYAWFAAVVGILASSPPYFFSAPEDAQIKLSLSHPGKRKVECRLRSREELAKLPPNMRAPKDCPRERWPVFVELEVDGKRIFAKSAAPKGIANDGPSIFYQAFSVPAGPHRLTMRLRESGNEGFDFRRSETVTLDNSQVLVAGFDSASHSVFFK
ncbi:MAG: hypothetical protein ISR44_07575 [Rhodospirillales bacterium]|nr:hypothetical protein [Rhodospirillales bacterium]